MKKIIAFSGSNSTTSINQQLIHIVAKYAKEATVEIISLIDYPAIIYGVDEEQLNGFPETMVALQKKLANADGYIISTPEHNGSMPAVYKSTTDWLSRIGEKIYNNKPTVFLSTSPGPRGASSALEHLLAISPFRGANVIGGYSVGSFQDKVENGELTDIEDVNAIKALVEQLENQL